MFENIIHSTTGLLHTIAAVVAMVLGVVVVLKTKGTKLHKQLGYVYVVAMLFLNISSFFIQNFNGFSIFHFFAIISIISIVGGIGSMWLKLKNALISHYYFMSWSVVGLYCAFWAELGTRFVGNMRAFWWMVALATIITTIIGGIIINKHAKKLGYR